MWREYITMIKKTMIMDFNGTENLISIFLECVQDFWNCLNERTNKSTYALNEKLIKPEIL